MDRVIKEALEERRKFTRGSSESIKQYVGRAYRVGFGHDNYDNFPYKYVTTVAPRLAMFAPSCTVTEGGMVTEETDALQDGLRSWMRMSGLARVLVALAHDVLFDFGCVLTALEPTPKWRGQPGGMIPMWPRTMRVSPRAVFRDPRAVELAGSRFDGHMAIVARESLRKAVDAYGRPLYDEAAVLSLKSGGTDLEQLKTDLMADGVTTFDADKSVLLYCVTDYETGQVATYAAGGNEGVTLIRKPVKADRKYTFYGVGLVPDQLYPLSPLVVTQQQVEEINQHRRFLSKSAGSAKRLTIVQGTDTGLIANITEAPHGGVLAVAGFNGSVQTIDLGGPVQASYDYLAFTGGELKELAGLSDIEQGNLADAETAAEINEAAAGSDIRRAFMRELFRTGVRETLEGVVSIMDETETVAFPVTRTNTAGQMVKGTFYGGRDLEDDEWPWDRTLSVEIEPNSMEYVNRASQQAAMQAAQGHVITTAAAYLQNPALKPQPMVDDMMEALNVKRGGDRYIDFAFLQQVMQAQQMAAAAASANDQSPSNG
jgi:hypothetical protein